ncbi:NADH dehydrogenase [ubiquinone] 1 alpha subcomplex assembly factor 3-like [Sitodiplosis mosellana]|uniref:NADH dehydrogenase [ubiquinone] 1 alpha subcomplex assembly factor 3-like n=1 Tax=Sitodiplosis mosellana TaxID=263140 RepID=UPI002444F87C|nr:NADH dehydrogenase [ubiquinone] 1 alpha subcomplex assembly factor 3-like [Sitodiplosis mosellana]
MRVFKSVISLLNRQAKKETLSATNRLYNSDGKSVNCRTDAAKSVEQTQKNNEPERQKYNPIVESHFEDGVSITSYNTFGFRLNQQISVIGPVIVFPRTVFSWHVESVERINADSLVIFGLVQPRIETLIIGTGEFETTSHVGKNILEIAHKHKINIEILTTELACTQFNYLNAEGRMIAAALIPPKETRIGEDDIFCTQNFDSKLFTIDSMHTEDIRNFTKKK